MLCISRKVGETFFIGPEIEVKVLSMLGGKVSLGIAAPKKMRITRDDWERSEDETGDANGAGGADGGGQEP